MTNNSHSSHISKAIIATLTLLFITGLGAAATVTVGDSTSADNSTIGAAIDYASSGDTIEVEDGTYEVTDRINVDKSVTIKSAGSYRPVINNTDDGWAALKVTADDVTLESLKFVNLANSNAERVRGLHGNRDSDGLTIKDVVVDGVDGEVPDADFDRSTAFGMTLLGNSTSVMNSEVKDVAGQKFAAGIRLGGNSSLKVEGGTVDNVDISGIEETGQGTDSVGIFLASISSGEQTVVKDTQVSGLTATDGSAGIYLLSKNQDADKPDVNMKSNDLGVSGGTQGSSGIYVEDSAFTDLSQVVVSDNDFSGSDAGAANADTDDTLDASGNYWGSAAGPQDSSNTYNEESQGVKADNVAFTPWLDAAGGSNFAPVENTDTGTGYPSIQAAVDAASEGDTIEVKDGTYSEFVKISTPGIELVSVNGADETEISSGQYEGVMIEDSNVTVRGFTVTTNLGDTGSHGQSGIRVEPKSGNVQDIRIEDNVVRNISDANRAQGINVDMRWSDKNGADNRTATNVTVIGNEVKNIRTYQAGNGKTVTTGIGFNERVHNLTVKDNTVQDIGNSSSQGALGIKLTEDWSVSPAVGPQDFEVIDNTIEDVTVDSQTYGDAFYDAHAVFIGGYNDLGDNHKFRDNQFGGESVYRYTSASPMDLDARHNYWGQHSGPEDDQIKSGNVDYRPWLLTADGKHYDETIQVDGGSWSLVSAPEEADMSKSDVKVDDGGTSTQVVYDAKNEDWVSPSGGEVNPLGASFIRSSNDAAVGFVYTGSSQVSKEVYEGWNMIGSTKEIRVQDALGGIGNSVTLFYAPDAYNSEKSQGFKDFTEDNRQIDATSLSGLQSELTTDKVSKYDGYWVDVSKDATLDMSVPQPTQP